MLYLCVQSSLSLTLNEPRKEADVGSCDVLKSTGAQRIHCMGQIQAVLQRRSAVRLDIGSPIENCDPAVQLQNAREL